MKLIHFSLLGLTAASSLKEKWAAYKSKHGKIYQNSVEESRRFNLFKKSVKFIREHNNRFENGLETFSVALNNFADLSDDEFQRFYLGETIDTLGLPNFRLNYQCPVEFKDSGISNPTSVDYRSANSNPKKIMAVTPVKDQGACGSCWSFSTAAAFEGAMCLDNQQDCNSWFGASEQQLVDCSTADNDLLGHYYDMGCNGGWADNGLYYIIQNGGIENYSDYPYVSGNTQTPNPTCEVTNSKPAGSLSNCGATKKNSETDLESAVNQVGIMAVAIDASGLGFRLYSSGVYTSNKCSSTAVNHAVTAVGYSNEDRNEKYWIVKNSWGTSWGNEGYVYMRKDYDNMCGIAVSPAYAIA